MRNNLKKRFEDVCNEYVSEFCRLYDFDVDITDVWVANDVGGIACIGDNFFNFIDVIKYAVDNSLRDYDDLMDWYYYTIWADEFGQTIPNFSSWSKGCPRAGKEEQQKLIDMKKELEKSIKEYKEKF